jgi:stage V sporulation protein B
VRKSFASGAIILMAAGLAARLLGFAYRIYLSNLVGAEGMGLYELVVPVYTAVVLTITSGITIAVSRMVAEQNARLDRINPGRVTVCALWLAAAAGMPVSAVISFNAEILSLKVLGDERTYSALLVLVPCLPAVVAAAALKGYFYGMQNVVPTAFSQTAEQAAKFLILLIAADAILEKGPGFASAIAVFAAAAGEIFNMLILLAVFSMRKKGRLHNGHASKVIRRARIIRELMKAAVPVSANRLVISALSAAEYILIPAMLSYGGLDEKSSMEVFGRLTGMALPLIMFPSVVTNSIATTLVPALSESAALKRYKALNYQISRSIQITFILGIIFSSLFICFSHEIGSLLYRREKIGDLLYMLSFSGVFIYLQQTLTGVLNGLGRQGILLRNTVVGSVLRIAVICLLMPVSGIKIYIVGMTASLILTESLNLITINRITGLVFDLRGWIVKPGLAGIAIIFVGRYVYYFIEIFRLSPLLTILLSLSVNVVIAGILLIFMGVLKAEEILSMVGLRNTVKIFEK